MVAIVLYKDGENVPIEGVVDWRIEHNVMVLKRTRNETVFIPVFAFTEIDLNQDEDEEEDNKDDN